MQNGLRQRLRSTAVWSAGWALLGATLIARAEPSGARPPDSSPETQPVPAPAVRPYHVYGLSRCLELMEQNFPKIQEARAKLSHKQAELWQAKTAPFSEFGLTSGVGPAPTVRGTSVYSPNTDQSLSSHMGLAWQFHFNGTVPLWTFGKIKHTQEAAQAQVKLGEHELEKEKNDARLLVRRLYYGIQLARDSRILLKEAAEQIDKHIASLASKVAEGEGDDIQLLKARMFRADLEAKDSEATRQERLAVSGLRSLTGVEGAFDIPDQPLRKIEHTLKPLPVYLAAARLYRPEVNMARAGVKARSALVEVERARFYPDFGVSFFWEWVRAPEVQDQLNPFVYDRANFHYYGFGFGLRWKLDFLPQAAKLAQAKADLEQTRALERLALGAAGMEVEQAFEEAKDAERRLRAHGRAARYARQWLVKVQQGIDVGTYEEQDIVEPAKEYALRRFAVMSATMDYNVALAHLGQATGWLGLLRESGTGP
jgi:outer membrane protein TolC